MVRLFLYGAFAETWCRWFRSTRDLRFRLEDAVFLWYNGLKVISRAIICQAKCTCWEERLKISGANDDVGFLHHTELIELIINQVTYPHRRLHRGEGDWSSSGWHEAQHEAPISGWTPVTPPFVLSHWAEFPSFSLPMLSLFVPNAVIPWSFLLVPRERSATPLGVPGRQSKLSWLFIFPY